MQHSGLMPEICSKGGQVFSGIHHLGGNESGHPVTWLSGAMGSKKYGHYVGMMTCGNKRLEDTQVRYTLNQKSLNPKYLSHINNQLADLTSPIWSSFVKNGQTIGKGNLRE